MKCIISYILFFSLSLSVLSQEIDSVRVILESNLKEANSDAQKLRAMLALGELELDHNFTKAKYIINDAFELINKTPTKFTNHEKALVLVQYGVLKRRLGKHVEALDSYLQALKRFEVDEDDKNIADVYHNIAMVYRSQKEYRKSIQYFKKSIAVNQALDNNHGVGQATLMLGVSYSSTKQLDSALICYNKAKAIFNTLNADEQLQEVNDNLVAIYRKQQDYDAALNLSLKNVDYSKRKGKQLALCGNYYDTALVYEKLKAYKLAGKYVDSSIKLAKKEKFIHRIAKGYKKRSQLWNKLENYGAAYRDYKRFKKYSDSIFNIETVSQIQELELKYTFEKEQQEAKLIAENERSKKWLYLALFILTLIGAITITLLVRKNYRNKIELERINHKAETLSLDQEIKNKEVNVKQLIADNTMRLDFKKELLDRIRNGNETADAKEFISKLANDLRLQIETESKLSNLQYTIDATNISFDTILKTRFSDLTKGEREVASLLRLNLSVKEIMTIRNVSEDSVKSMRRRIRKKMQVPKAQRIEDFIQSLN
ncbi:tetratricopeptide repeat protein [uncultured Psychroserpens sp.]|uniref:tetratricopeptide repeat protein n=1 Tax=uncultured Psychroserpens sp. TaxID=255436 RepID=UPI002635C96D|nr:tetratricopeptide repeat protein [uncultured Psychroserpens sp.]